MLAAIVNTTLHDDVFREDATTLDFEQDIALRCGMEAGAFTVTGTMANQLGLRTLLTQPPHAILTDARAHILENEAGGAAFLSGAMLQEVHPSNDKYLTLEDIKEKAEITDNVHKCPTRVIALENTISGVVVPLDEIRRISSWAHANGILMHLDGARLFEAVATGSASLKDYCTPFDTVAVDFSKNLGAPMGAMLLASTRLVAQARRIRKSIGGGLRQSGILTAACRAAVDEQFGYGEWGSEAGKIRGVHRMAARVGDMWIAKGGKLTKPVETNQVWLNLVDAAVGTNEWNEFGHRHDIKFDGSRLVLHHQISEDALSRVGKCFDEIFQRNAPD
jgi:threonine aldolase